MPGSPNARSSGSPSTVAELDRPSPVNASEQPSEPGCQLEQCGGVAPLHARRRERPHRHRLNPGGNRQANHALWRIVFTRMSSDERTRKYVARRLAEGRSTREIMRSLEALRRPRALPAPRARLTRSGVTGLAHELPRHHRLSFERTAGPSLPNTFGTAWPHKSSPSPEWPITGLPAPPKPTLDKHRSFGPAPLPRTPSGSSGACATRVAARTRRGFVFCPTPARRRP